jgi:hypothetical protein
LTSGNSLEIDTLETENGRTRFRSLHPTPVLKPLTYYG